MTVVHMLVISSISVFSHVGFSCYGDSFLFSIIDLVRIIGGSVGGSIGGTLILTILIVGLCFCCCKKGKSKSNNFDMFVQKIV